jgi:hypothetical protein
MAARTGAEIKAHLEEAMRANAPCLGARFAITIRRVEDKRRRATGAWYADVRISGKPEDAEACEEAVSDVIASAQDDFELAAEC